MDTLANPSNQPLHDAVVERWGWDIVSGKLAVGSQIVTDQVVNDLGVSRTVVREAVRVLECMGLVCVRRRVGITVQPADAWAPFDPNVLRWRLAGPERLRHLRSLIELRSAVEPLAARLAAERATQEQCGALSAAVIGMSFTARAANAPDYLAHDIAFHQTLLEASGNPMLSGLTGVVAAILTGRTEHELMPSVADPEALRLHSLAATAVQASDGDAAERALAAIVAESTGAIEQRAGQLKRL